MPKFRVTVYETYKVDYLIDANSAAEGVVKVLDGDGDGDWDPSSVDFVDIDQSYGMCDADDPKLLTDLRAVGAVNGDDDAVPGLHCVVEESQK